MNILNVGGRVKHYRKLLNISQKELADNKVSSNLISLIERGRVPLSTVTASILVDNINRIAMSKGIDMKLSIRDLLMSNEDYLESQCKDKINKYMAERKLEGAYDEILKIADENGFLHIKAYLEECMAQESFEIGNFNSAINHYIKFIQLINSIKTNCEAYVYLHRVGLCYMKLRKYDKALDYLLNSYEDLIKCEYDHMEAFEMLYEITVCYYNLNLYNNMSEYFEKIAMLENITDKAINKTLLLKANMYLQLNDLEMALSIYKNLIGKDVGDISVIYGKIAYILDKLNRKRDKVLDKDNSHKHFQLSNDIHRFINIGDKYVKDEVYENAIVYYDLALKNAYRERNLEIMIKCYNQLLNIYKNLNKVEVFETYANGIAEILNWDIIDSEERTEFLIILLQYFFQTGKYVEAKTFIRRLKNII